MFVRRRVWLTLAALLLPFGCGGDLNWGLSGVQAGGNAECAGGRRWVVLLDLSGSISDTQRHSWAVMAKTQLAPKIEACDEVLVLGVHEASLTAAPLLVDSVPGLNGQEGLNARIAVLNELDAVRTRLIDAIATASHGQGEAPLTDLLGALRRAGPTEGHQTNITICSDMMHAAADLNLESTPVGGRVESMTESVISRLGWEPTRFASARVAVVLPSQRGGTKGPNGREELQEFWSTLFERAGGQLVSFETYIPDGLF